MDRSEPSRDRPEDKSSQGWGHAQAESLWNNLYSRYSPAIDGQTVLDLGCSWGYLLKFLSETFQPGELIGTDISPFWDETPHGWDHGAAAVPIRFHQGDLPEITEISDRTVDLALCTSVLQYMTPEQVEANLERVFELLRPGGEMILRTRVFTSYIGADLHDEIDLPYVHLLYSEPEIRAFLGEEAHAKTRYLNWLTASTYVAIFIRSGFEILDLNRRMNDVAPEVMERVVDDFPWIPPDELLCAEVEARLLRPVEIEDVETSSP